MAEGRRAAERGPPSREVRNGRSKDLPMKTILRAMGFSIVLLFALGADCHSQGLEKVLVTHSSESISIAPLQYGIERGLYRKEGLDVQFRILRGDLAIGAMVGSREVDYICGAGTAFTAAVKGFPVTVLSHDFKSVFFYLMAQPNVSGGRELKGGKVAVSSLGGTGTVATRATLKAIGLNPDRDVTVIVIGSASVRMAAMEAGSVQAAIMPVPWNIRMRKKGFKELIYAGKVMSQPLTGVAASREKIGKSPDQVRKMIRGFLASLNAVKREKKEVVHFIGRKYSLEPDVAEEVYGIMVQNLTEDGTVPESVLLELLEQSRSETGVKKDIPLSSVVDYRILKEVAKDFR